jgi:glycerate dehydrogenase
MEIVILDGKTLIQNDLSWDSFEELGKVTMYDRTPYEEEEIVKRIGEAEVVLTNKVPITASIMDRCPNMKYVGVTATGYNVVDVRAAAERNVIVTNAPGYATDAVAEFVFAMLLHMTRQVSLCSESVHRGDWCNSEDFCYLPGPQTSLGNKTMGLIGYGQIGKRTAEIAQAFGMNILVYTRHPKKEEETRQLTFVSLEEVLTKADVVSLHCPLTEENKYLINETTLRQMKPEAYLINTSRGPLVEEKALAKALKEGWIKGAALDVIETEPMPEDCALLDAPNCILAPHVAWATKECRENLMKMVRNSIQAYLDGKPVYVVS